MSAKNRNNNINVGANSIVYSGRGRPRTKDIVADRPLPVGIVLSPGSPSTGDLYKNRKIRVGGPFQAKIPKHEVQRDETTGKIISSNYASSRPLPEPVSERYPHLTRQEQEEAERTETQNQLAEGKSTRVVRRWKIELNRRRLGDTRKKWKSLKNEPFNSKNLRPLMELGSTSHRAAGEELISQYNGCDLTLNREQSSGVHR